MIYISFQLFISAVVAPAIVRPLYAALPGYAQRAAFAPCPEKGARKFVLATNIAETSVTVPGILCLPPQYHLNEATKHSTVSWNNCSPRSSGPPHSYAAMLSFFLHLSLIMINLYYYAVGVRYVVDSGLVKKRRFHPREGLESLRLLYMR